MAVFHFELVSPERLLFAGDVESVIVPGADGDFQVMKNHALTMSTMRPGIVVVEEGAVKSMRLFVRGGFAEVSEKGLTILAEEALPAEELNADRIGREIRNAEEDLADAKTEDARRDAAERLDRLKELKAAMGM